ncbi:MAG TPA: D-alanyl-D-alanine carboxypeptidase family protein [Clostridiaceae bacterium]
MLQLSLPVMAEETGITVDAKSALLMEPSTGKILYEKNIHEKLAPASVTKIMTMLLTMEAIDSGRIKLTDKVVASENAKNMGGSSMILETGEVRTVEELLKGIAIASGNDAAVAMGEFLSGSEGAFATDMNARAKALGMNDTTFKNCTGLSAPGHVSSAYDIAIMSMELLKHPAILKYSGTYMETITEGRKTPIGLVNHNKLVRFFKGCDGLKTGFTDDAKYCISATATRDGVRMLSIVVGAPDYKVRNRDASMLLNYGFSRFDHKAIVIKDADMKKVILDKDGKRFYIAKAKDGVNLIVEKGSINNITNKQIFLADKKSYKKGDIVGQWEYYQDGKLCGKTLLYCDRDIERPGLLDGIKDNFKKLYKNSI